MTITKNNFWVGRNIRYEGQRYIVIDVIDSCFSKATFLVEDIKTKVQRRITRKL